MFPSPVSLLLPSGSGLHYHPQIARMDSSDTSSSAIRPLRNVDRGLTTQARQQIPVGAPSSSLLSSRLLSVMELPTISRCTIAPTCSSCVSGQLSSADHAAGYQRNFVYQGLPPNHISSTGLLFSPMPGWPIFPGDIHTNLHETPVLLPFLINQLLPSGQCDRPR